MNTMNYKGYIGSIEVSEEDNCLFGKVLALPHDTMITYEGNTEPRKSYSGALNVRISPETHSKVALLAKQAGISINAFIRNAVEKQIAAML